MTILTVDAKQDIRARYEELLSAANLALYNAQRSKTYWERAIAALDADDASPDFHGEPPALQSALQVKGDVA